MHPPFGRMAGASGGVGRASRGSIAARARCVFWDGVSLLISVRAVDFLFKIKETLLIFSDLARMLARPGGTLEPLSLSRERAEDITGAHTDLRGELTQTLGSTVRGRPYRNVKGKGRELRRAGGLLNHPASIESV